MSKKKAQQSETVAAERRETFLPQTEAPPPPEVIEADSLVQPEERISLIFERTDERNIRLTLSIPPLRPCIENRLLPLRTVSPELLASITADMITRAAMSASEDGKNQHYRREQEENEARERYGRR